VPEPNLSQEDYQKLWDAVQELVLAYDDRGYGIGEEITLLSEEFRFQRGGTE